VTREDGPGRRAIFIGVFGFTPQQTNPCAVRSASDAEVLFLPLAELCCVVGFEENTADSRDRFHGEVRFPAGSILGGIGKLREFFAGQTGEAAAG
jgi:hypothetical protein